MGSNSEVCSPTEADASRPIDPLMQLASSVRMSPKVFSVTRTSKNFGQRMSCMAALSTNM